MKLIGLSAEGGYSPTELEPQVAFLFARSSLLLLLLNSGNELLLLDLLVSEVKGGGIVDDGLGVNIPRVLLDVGNGIIRHPEVLTIRTSLTVVKLKSRKRISDASHFGESCGVHHTHTHHCLDEGVVVLLNGMELQVQLPDGIFVQGDVLLEGYPLWLNEGFRFFL